jgi:hypothetical protein
MNTSLPLSCDEPIMREDMLRVYVAINCVVCTLSLVGSLFVILCYVRFPRIRKFSFRLVVYLAISDAVYSIVLLLPSWQHPPVPPGGAMCQAQGFGVSWSTASSVCWASCIAHYLSLSTLGAQPVEIATLQRWEGVYMALAWLVPAIPAVLPLAPLLDLYGYAGEFCWINNSELGLVLRFATFYIPLWASIIFCLRVYVRLYVKYSRLRQLAEPLLSEEPPRAHSDKTLRRLWCYPCISIVGFGVFGLAHRLHSSLTNDCLAWLVIAHRFFAGLVGFLNAICYAAQNRHVRSEILSLCRGDRSGNADASGSVKCPAGSHGQ